MIKVIVETNEKGKVDANVDLCIDKEIKNKADYILDEATAVVLATCESLREKLSDETKKKISINDFLEIIYLTSKSNLEEDKETIKERKSYGSPIN